MLFGVRHTYGFAIDDECVVEEWLYTYPKRRKRVLFEREGEKFAFGDSASARLRQVKDITGPNVLFLTVAARAGGRRVAEREQAIHVIGTLLPSWRGGFRTTSFLG